MVNYFLPFLQRKVILSKLANSIFRSGKRWVLGNMELDLVCDPNGSTVHPLKATQYRGRGGEISGEYHPCAIASKSRGDYANKSHSSFWGLVIVFHCLCSKESAKPRRPFSEPTGDTTGVFATFKPAGP